jgi:hypothetical protein
MHRLAILTFTLLLGSFGVSLSYASSEGHAAATEQAVKESVAGDKIVEQPIEFPHNTHAEKMGINCMYCHTYARRSIVSGIPPLQKCMGCHQNIESVKDKPRIKKLFAYWEKKEAIPWKKVHDLPDYVRFNHERHIQRFYFQQGKPVQEVCGYCHGEVKKMTVARQVKPLTMGWCRSCHQEDHQTSKTNPDTTHGPSDCWVCHK